MPYNFVVVVEGRFFLRWGRCVFLHTAYAMPYAYKEFKGVSAIKLCKYWRYGFLDRQIERAGATDVDGATCGKQGLDTKRMDFGEKIYKVGRSFSHFSM